MAALSELANLIKLPLLRAGRSYNATAQQYPLATGVVTTVVKTSAADLFAQKVVEKRDEVDWKRHTVFCSFGLLYLGCFQYFLYNHLFVVWCKHITAVVGHHGSAPIKTFIDQAIHHPFFYFPTFYLMKGAMESRPLASTYERYRSELWENCKALWTIWVPAQLVNFAIVPRHLRIPYVAGVSFLWTIIISCMRGTLEKVGPTTQEIEGAMAAVAAASADAAAPALLAAAGGAGGTLLSVSRDMQEPPHLGLKSLVASSQEVATAQV